MTFFGRVLSSEGRYTIINIHDGIWYFISSFFDRVIHDGKVSYSNEDSSIYATPKNFQVKAFYKNSTEKESFKRNLT